MPCYFHKAVSDFEQKAKFEVTRIIRNLKNEHPHLQMVYLPNVSPQQKVRNILIGMEPSFGGWAKSEAGGEEKVRSGFRNFLLSVEDMIIHFCASKYLNGGYHITDVSKIAIKTKDAGEIREEARAKQKDLLIKELTLFGGDDCRIIPVGKSSPAGSGEWIEKNIKGHAALKHTQFCEPVLHYSFMASRYRTEVAGTNPDGFKKFYRDWDQAEFNAVAMENLSRMENCESEKRMLNKRLVDRLTDSRLHLAFTYKTEFEKVGALTNPP